MKRLLFVLTFVLGCGLIVGAQTTITSTTLSAAVTSTTATTITVASATTFVAGNYAYVDQEAMLVRSASSTTITVERGVLSTQSATHKSGATILVGNPGHFKPMVNGAPPYGRCIRTAQQYLPIIDAKSGNIWSCDGNQLWIGTNSAQLVYNSIQSR